jgi:hypothetical protein
MDYSEPDFGNQKLRINIEDLETVKCPACNGEIFEELTKFRKISPIITGKAMEILPEPVFCCHACKYILKNTDIVPIDFSDKRIN